MITIRDVIANFTPTMESNQVQAGQAERETNGISHNAAYAWNRERTAYICRDSVAIVIPHQAGINGENDL